MFKNKAKNVYLWAATALLAVFTALGALAAPFTKTALAKADESATDESVVTDISQATAWYNGNQCTTGEANAFMLHLTEADYMTADEWGTDSGEAYKWVNETLAYEDRTENNVCNAVLDKNLDSYNFLDSVFIDGVALREYEGLVLKANLYTRVNTLGLVFNTNVIGSAEEIVVKAGCQIPSLLHSYFGKEFACMEIQEELIFKNKDGVWSKKYPFDGYNAGELYDANERFFYLRPAGSTYKGHAEAATFEFTNIFSRNNWGNEEGYALASTSETTTGWLFVAELVNPIDVEQFGLLYLNVYTNAARTVVSHNASSITANSLGEVTDTFNIPAGFSTIKLTSALYANEDGMIDTIVFEFRDNGDETKPNENQLFITSFYCEELLITTPVYDESFFIQEDEEAYQITFRFNKKGAFEGDEALDTSKVFLNDESLDSINEKGSFAIANWSAIQGIYQINVKLSKDYPGAAQIKNPDKNYAGNKMGVAEGLAFPNGELLDRDYTCHIYGAEKFVDYELLKSYQKASVANISGFIDSNSADNIHFLITFDVQITSQVYYHACDREGWRSTELVKYNLYDGTFTPVYIAGGFKSSLLDNVLINGKSLGEIHTEDSYTTCVFVHYGQTDLYTLDVCVDSNSSTYDALYPIFVSGSGIEVEVKEGLKFTTGYKVSEGVKYAMSNGTFKSVSDLGEMKVFFDGKPVADGDVIDVETVATAESVSVSGVESFNVMISEEDGLKKFTVESNEGQIVTFSVRETILPASDGKKSDGCGSALSVGFVSVCAALSVGAVAVMARKKKDEE